MNSKIRPTQTLREKSDEVQVIEFNWPIGSSMEELSPRHPRVEGSSLASSHRQRQNCKRGLQNRKRAAERFCSPENARVNSLPSLTIRGECYFLGCNYVAVSVTQSKSERNTQLVA